MSFEPIENTEENTEMNLSDLANEIQEAALLGAQIKVIGVGGGGCNEHGDHEDRDRRQIDHGSRRWRKSHGWTQCR